MKLDLAFVLIDLEPWYKQATCEMIRSARRAYQGHEMRVVQLTDNRSAHCPEADGFFAIDTDVKGNELAYAKGHLMAEYALKTDRPVIFCDVDLVWNNDSLIGALEHVEHVGCLWRENMACMPFNTGIVMTHPNKQFWVTYRDAIDNLPSEIRAWWGDQVAMTAADCATGGTVTRMSMDAIAPCVEALPDAPLDTPAVHFKGDTKNLMLPYARMVDRGAGFEFARPRVSAVLYSDGAPPIEPMIQRQGFTF